MARYNFESKTVRFLLYFDYFWWYILRILHFGDKFLISKSWLNLTLFSLKWIEFCFPAIPTDTFEFHVVCCHLACHWSHCLLDFAEENASSFWRKANANWTLKNFSFYLKTHLIHCNWIWHQRFHLLNNLSAQYDFARLWMNSMIATIKICQNQSFSELIKLVKDCFKQHIPFKGEMMKAVSSHWKAFKLWANDPAVNPK